MAIPKGLPNIQDVAKAWKNSLDSVAAKCQKAKDYIDADREHLISAYQGASTLLVSSQNLAAGGYTADVLGPVVGSLYGVDWTQYADDWAELRDALLPALTSTIKANEADVVRGSLNASGDISLNAVLPTQAREAILATLDAVLAKFA